MATFRLEVRVDNAAFTENDHTDLELARILRGLADRVGQGDYTGILRDANGARVGQFEMED